MVASITSSDSRAIASPGVRPFSIGGILRRNASVAAYRPSPRTTESAKRQTARRGLSDMTGPPGPIERASGTSLRLEILMRTMRASSSSSSISPSAFAVPASYTSRPARSLVSCSGNENAWIADLPMATGASSSMRRRPPRHSISSMWSSSTRSCRAKSSHHCGFSSRRWKSTRWKTSARKRSSSLHWVSSAGSGSSSAARNLFTVASISRIRSESGLASTSPPPPGPAYQATVSGRCFNSQSRNSSVDRQSSSL